VPFSKERRVTVVINVRKDESHVGKFLRRKLLDILIVPGSIRAYHILGNFARGGA
jgi:hypothetical protein